MELLGLRALPASLYRARARLMGKGEERRGFRPPELGDRKTQPKDVGSENQAP